MGGIKIVIKINLLNKFPICRLVFINQNYMKSRDKNMNIHNI